MKTTPELAPWRQPVDNPARGILLMLVAMMIVPLMDALAKYLSARYPVPQIVWARFFFHFTILAPVVLYRYRMAALRPRRPVLQLVRGGFLLAATMLFFAAISHMPLADALALLFISPLVVTALSPALLDERVGPRRWAAVLVGFAGALIVIRPGFGVFQWSSILALGAGGAFAFYVLATRRLSGSAPPLVTLTYTAVVGVIAMSVLLPWYWITPTLPDLAMMAGIGTIAAGSHLLLIRAYDHAPASLLAPYSYSEIIMATALGFVWFGDFPGRWTWVGIAVIVASGIYISVRERVIETR